MTHLEDLWDELNRGRIWECSLRSAKWQMDGLQSGENIYIDPRPAILETVVHELIHRRHPRLSERTVTTEARRLIASMDEGMKRKWWKQYRALRKMGAPVDVDE